MFVVLEIVQKADGTLTVNKYVKETQGEADKAYYSILAVAAVSTHPIHSGVLMNPEGAILAKKSYKRIQDEPDDEMQPAELAQD